MVLKSAREVCDYSDNKDGIICSFNGKRLNDLEMILNIVKSNFKKIKDVDFFEMGSQEWNPSHYGPRSGIGSHFMGIGSGLPYKCFDSYCEAADFDVNVELIEAYKKSEKESVKNLGLRIPFMNPLFLEAERKFYSLDKNKDLSDLFVCIRNEEYYKKFYEYYEGIDLNNLKKEIKGFSVEQYNQIIKSIELSKNPVVYSKNVLNAPNLNDKFKFWNIKNCFQVHSGSLRELSEKIEVNSISDLIWRRTSISKEEILKKEEEIIDNFKHQFNLLDNDIKLRLGLRENKNIYFLFWNASK